MPYGHMPTDDGKACGAPDADGLRPRARSRRTDAAKSANERGDTYGPVSYLAYVPGYLAVGFDGKWNGGSSTWDDLPAAHLTSLLWDLLALVGMGAARASLRRAHARGDARLRVGGLPLHAVRLELELERRDHARASRSGASSSSPRRRRAGSSSALGRLDEVRRAPAPAALGLVSELARRAAAARSLFLAASCSATALGVLDPLPRARSAPRGARLLGPDVRLAALALVAVLDLGLERVPGLPRPPHRPDRAQGGPPRRRRGRARLRASRARTCVQLAALSAALLIGFELVLTHWFYLYIPWFFPFVAFALLRAGLLPVRAAEPAEPPPELERRAAEQLVPTTLTSSRVGATRSRSASCS